MAETYTFRRARIVDQRWLGLHYDAGAARSGLLTVDPSKFSITLSGGAVGWSLTTADQLLSVVGTIGAASAWLPPAYTSVDKDVTNQAVLWVKLDRPVAHTETGTFTATAGFISDDTNTSEAVTDQPIEIRTFCDSSGVISDTSMGQRVGCGDRPKLDPSTLSPVLFIKASDAASVGDGNNITTFTATAGGTITASGGANQAVYRANYTGKGTAGCETIELQAGRVLTSTATLSSSTAPFTLIVVSACPGTRGNLTFTGASAALSQAAVGANYQKRWNPAVGGSALANLGGRYDLEPWKRMDVAGLTYSHADTRVRNFGAGGSFIAQTTRTTTADHSVAITITAAQTHQIAGVVVVEGELTAQQVQQIGAYFDDLAQTTSLSYYIDVDSGNDSNDGYSAASPRLTPPAWSTNNRDWINRGAGDRVFYKYGQELDGHIINNNADLNATFGYSSQYPVVLGCYGDRSHGRFRIARRASGTGEIGGNSAVAHSLFFGFEVYSERRDPRNTNYAGFSVARDDNGGGMSLPLLADLEDTRLWYDLAGDPALQHVHDCAWRYTGNKGIADDSGGNVDERWVIVSNCLFDHIWYGFSSVNVTIRPAGMFMSNSSVLLVSRNTTNYCGWNPDIASIGDWSAGARTFTAEATATYATTGDQTTITLTGAFALYAHSSVGPQLLTVKRTSDATEHVVSIKSKTNDNTIVVNGNPFSLADGGSVSDCLCHGGTPAGADGRNHGFYISAGIGDNEDDATGSTRAATLVTENLHLYPADHGTQMRGGGYLINNLFVNAAIGGYVSGTGIAVIRGNYVEGGRRTVGDNSGSNGPRAWGVAVNSGVQSQYFTSVRENICNLGFQDELAAFAPTVNNNTYALSIGKRTGNEYAEFTNNTIARGARNLADHSGNENLDSSDDFRRNIIQQPTTAPDAVTETRLTAAELVGGGVSHNIYYHPGGASDTRWNAGTETLAQWITTTGGTGEQFKEVTYTNGNADIAEYYSTLPGGTDSLPDFIDAVLAASESGDMTGFTAEEILAWMRLQYRPTNLTLADGGGTYAPGAVGLAASTASPRFTDLSGNPISSPVSISTLVGNSPSRFLSLRTDEAISGIGIGTTGVVSKVGDFVPLALPSGGTFDFEINLNASTVGASQPGSITASATGRDDFTLNYLLTVTNPWSVKRSDGSAIPANPIGGTYAQSSTNATFQIRIDANGDSLDNFSFFSDGIATLPTGPAELAPMAPGESKILTVFLNIGTIGAAQTGEITIDFEANGVAVDTITLEFSINVIAPVIGGNRARTRDRLR